VSQELRKLLLPQHRADMIVSPSYPWGHRSMNMDLSMVIAFPLYQGRAEKLELFWWITVGVYPCPNKKGCNTAYVSSGISSGR
jgi:hypothetical protein